MKIVPRQGRVAHFTRRGLVLDDSSYLAADLVLYCTGYTKSYEYLPGSVKVRGGGGERKATCWVVQAVPPGTLWLMFILLKRWVHLVSFMGEWCMGRGP